MMIGRRGAVLGLVLMVSLFLNAILYTRHAYTGHKADKADTTVERLQRQLEEHKQRVDEALHDKARVEEKHNGVLEQIGEEREKSEQEKQAMEDRLQHALEELSIHKERAQQLEAEGKQQQKAAADGNGDGGDFETNQQQQQQQQQQGGNSQVAKSQEGGGEREQQYLPGVARNVFDDRERTCKPETKVVYVKTHKTGSSTLTNIFHRFAHKHKLKVALPKSNVFLGWPRSAGIPTSYVPLPGAEGNYDIFCSAHTRYSRKYIEAIVPNANYITIFREPTSHFKSSWNYWNVASHVKRVSGMDVTMEEFLEDPETWFPRGLKGDRDLLHNSFAFDFGFDHTYTQEDVDNLIAHLDTFALVLITEYMDESLVLMKRKLCWELEDAVYFALKVNKRKPKSQLPADVREKILKLNWVDAQLYNHFNQSLWRQIAREPNFEQEVGAFRDLKAQLSTQCQKWAKWNEDQHRKALLEEDGEPLPEHERQCHLAQMDSVGFVKFLKQEAGVPDLECSTQGQPKRRVVYVKTHKTGSSTLTNVLHRFAYKHNLRPVLPKNDIFLGYPSKEMLMSSYVKLPPVRGKDEYDVLCSAHSIYDRPRMNKLVPDAAYVTVLRDPATHFLSSWKYWHVSDHIKARSGKDVTMEQFIEGPDAYRNHLSEGDHRLIHNSMAFDLGLSNTPSRQEVEHLVSELNYRFDMVIITEYFDESLIMLRRQLCWKPEDILYLSLKVSKQAKSGGYEVPAAFRSKVEQYNWADARLYHALNMTLWYRINHAIGFKRELNWLRQEKERVADLCRSFAGWGDNLHRKAVVEHAHTMDEDEKLCHLMMLDSPGFVKVFKERFGKRDPECHNQPRQPPSPVYSSVLPTPQGLAVANLLHRYRLKRRGRAVVAAEGVRSLGYPDVSTVQGLRERVPTQAGRTRGLLIGVDAPLDKQVLESVLPHPHIVVMIANPTVSLAVAWEEAGAAAPLREALGRDVTFVEYVRDPAAYASHLSADMLGKLKNPLARGLGYSGDMSKPSINAFLRHLTKEVDTFLIGDHFYESVVHLRRVFCWPEDGLVVQEPALPSHMADDCSDPDVVAAVEKFNTVDASVFKTLNTTFFRRLRREVNLNLEMQEVRKRTTSFKKECNYMEVDPGTRQPSALDQLLADKQTSSTSKKQCLAMPLTLQDLDYVVRNMG